MSKKGTYNLKENEVTIHLVFNSCWKGKPFLDFMEDLDGYLMVVNPKKDMRRIKLLMKVAKKYVEKEQQKKSNYWLCKMGKEDKKQRKQKFGKI